jgi:RNA polymerase sigma factor (TIGR02999 family)
MEPVNHEITELLTRVRSGDKDAENRLYELVLPHLRRLARQALSNERPNHTVQGTELVNRMYVRLAGSEMSLRDRAHFFAVAARAMRRELIDYARSRPQVQVVPLDALPDSVLGKATPHEITLAINELLDDLHQAQPLECSIVELKVFFGMTDEETADSLGIPLRTMQLRWQDARIWLFDRAEAQHWKPQNPLK